MTAVTLQPQDVEAMARLGRVALTPAEVQDAAKKIGDILGHFSTIQAIDTTDITPADDVSGLTNIAREDVAQPAVLCAEEELLKRVPRRQQNFIQVRAVFE